MRPSCASRRQKSVAAATNFFAPQVSLPIASSPSEMHSNQEHGTEADDRAHASMAQVALACSAGRCRLSLTSPCEGVQVKAISMRNCRQARHNAAMPGANHEQHETVDVSARPRPEALGDRDHARDA
jgi:hypothetical protein